MFISFAATSVPRVDNFYLTCPSGHLLQTGHQRGDQGLGRFSRGAPKSAERREDGEGSQGRRAEPRQKQLVATASVPRGSDHTSDQTPRSLCSTSTRSVFWAPETEQRWTQRHPDSLERRGQMGLDDQPPASQPPASLQRVSAPPGRLASNRIQAQGLPQLRGCFVQ